ncbi:hypothetical protein FACS189468_4190 [Spirochaetia bacterium]|nr:hypothetical protein FACS189468_4190 [Spirochaetia bacterium]
MGETYAEITLKNAMDVSMLKRRLIKKAQVRQITVQAMADTGSADLIINEKIRRQLGLKIESSDNIRWANNYAQECHYTEAVAVQWKDRRTYCPAVVMAGADEALLGLIPLEAMDLSVDPVGQQVVGKHGDRAVKKAVGARRR